jgi:hypothetical protein
MQVYGYRVQAEEEIAASLYVFYDTQGGQLFQR